MYGESETNRLKNGEAFVTIENTGTGPGAVIGLQFTGDVPNPLENPRGNGIHGAEQIIIPSGKKIDLFSSSYPFGAETESGVGCSPEGNRGQFTVAVETRIGSDEVSTQYDAEYSGSTDMTDCEVTIREA
ncbi:hypothetical protein [Halobacterium sp. CBA1126]|uniref:hypothetical protein n=1 Tax=Halobacterium sp. CBA1126 TaxID=2668074 RepID=UPI001E4D282A|nr:hypothetical protein [Halobacterium sp. CBA1126]